MTRESTEHDSSTATDPTRRTGRRPGLVGFVLSCLLYAAVTAWVASALPRDRPIPSHWSFGAEPDAWSTWGQTVGFLIGLGAFLAVTFLLVLWLTARGSTELMNLPDKEYWTAPERLPATRHRLTEDIAWMGALTMLWGATVGPGLLASVEPPHHIPWWEMVATAAYLAALIGGAVLMTRRWKTRRDAPVSEPG